MTGGDADEFLAAFADRFRTDLDALRWCFHYNANEPPLSQHVFPFSPDGRRLPLRPITLTDLVAAAQDGRRTVTCPPQEVREIYPAKLTRWLFFGFVFAAVILWLWTRLPS